MKKVVVLGCSGSGKSTFSVQLHKATGLPLYHLDNVWWRPDRTHITREEFDEKLDELLARDSWIIDGDYSRTYEKRVLACDTVIFLDYGEDVCMRGIMERVGKERGDIPWTENELDPELVKLVREFETENKPVLLALFKKYPDRNVITFHTREEAERWHTGLAGCFDEKVCICPSGRRQYVYIRQTDTR
ncbi:MAG: adenylate kinase [Lachnospiraceae bacterium]|nr:adenylate kinase [Lachnospiraceae bacterium]